jgi:hypothetical protein
VEDTMHFKVRARAPSSSSATVSLVTHHGLAGFDAVVSLAL